LLRNQERDREKDRTVEDAGNRFIRIWDHERRELMDECLSRFRGSSAEVDAPVATPERAGQASVRSSQGAVKPSRRSFASNSDRSRFAFISPDPSGRSPKSWASFIASSR
jgi:hypothetical protein